MISATIPVPRTPGAILHGRIDAIIGKIPSDFPRRDSLEKALRDRQGSIHFTAPEAMGIRWQEVSSILQEYLPNPDEVVWASEIATLFKEDVD